MWLRTLYGVCQVDAGILSACRELIATHLHEYDLDTFHQFPPFALAGVLALASRHPDSYVRGRIVASYVRERDCGRRRRPFAFRGTQIACWSPAHRASCN